LTVPSRSTSSATRPIELSATVRWPRPAATPRTLAISQWFGLGHVQRSRQRLGGVTVQVGPGRVILLLGPSGSGKSQLLESLARRGKVRLARRSAADDDRPLVDTVGPQHSLRRAMQVLSACGLAEARCLLLPVRCLSDGQRFRALLAQHVAAEQPGQVLAFDNFGESLDALTARAMSHSLGRLARRVGLCLLLATTRDELANDLAADQVVHLDLSGRATLRVRSGRLTSRPAWWRNCRVERGTLADWRALAHLHYRSQHVGPVRAVFRLRWRNELLGVAVYAYPAPNLRPRHAVLAHLRNQTRQVNRELAVLSRLVVRGEVRGCGLAAKLVRQSLPRVGTPYVECLAEMAEVCPVFERAGFQRLGHADPPARCQRIVEQLAASGITPMHAGFAQCYRRSASVRRQVDALVRSWLHATRSVLPRQLSTKRIVEIARQVFATRPVYLLWRRDRR
jgi:energy-coupling factor transporter ATP-binding protein EcfA2